MAQISPTDSDRLAKRIIAHHSFPGASHAAIERVLAKGDCQPLDHGQDICTEGEPGDEVFFLVRGNITVLRKDASGEDRVLSDMTCPCVFGHMAVIDGSRRSATCRANGPVEVVRLHRSQVDQLVSEGSVAGVALRRLLIASLCDQLTNANGFVRKIVSDNAPDAPADVGPASVSSSAPNPLANRARKAAAPPADNTDDDLRKLAVKLGGWDTSLADLEEMEKEIELVMDEDQKRTLQARKLKFKDS